jgi:hypothetical protein
MEQVRAMDEWCWFLWGFRFGGTQKSTGQWKCGSEKQAPGKSVVHGKTPLKGY